MERKTISINPTIFLKVSEENPENVELVDNMVITQSIQYKAVVPFLLSVFESLSCHSDRPDLGVPKYAMNEYLRMPGLIGERFFNMINGNRNGYLHKDEFVGGLTRLFTKSFEESTKLVFDLFDFDMDGKISKEDIRTLLSHVPLVQILQVSDLAKPKEEDRPMQGSGMPLFLNRVRSQTELILLLEKFMKDKEQLTYSEFVERSNKESSTFFLCLYLLLRRTCPIYQGLTLFCAINKVELKPEDLKHSHKRSNSIIMASPKFESEKTTLSPLEGVAQMSPLTPDRPSSLRSAARAKCEVRKDRSLNAFSQFATEAAKATAKKDAPIREEEKIPAERTGDKNEVPTFATKSKRTPWIDSSALEYLAVSPVINTEAVRDVKPEMFSQAVAREERKAAVSTMICACSGEVHSTEEECRKYMEKKSGVTYSAYLYEKTKKDSLNRSWYKLVGNTLYRYDSRGDKDYNGIISLVGCLLKEELPFFSSKMMLYPFKLLFGSNEVMLFSLKEGEKDAWVSKIKEAIGYSNFTDFYQLKEPLGNGKFGLVRAAIHKKTGERVAVKIMKKKKLSVSELDLAKREIEILKICQHPNIIRIYDTFENTECIFIVMELLKGGDLYDFLEKRKFNILEARACNIVHSLATALYYMHSYGIVHRDIKLENILMVDQTDSSDAKIVDFGLSKMIGPNEKCTEPFGTFGYAAPEVLVGKPYDKAIDIWSLGVVLYILLSGESPFEEDADTSEKKVAWNTVNKEPNYAAGKWKVVSAEAKDCVKRMLKKSPAERMTLTELLMHPWIKKYCAEAIALRLSASKEFAFQCYSLLNPLSAGIFTDSHTSSP